jgi:hypothetical protein
LSTSLRSNGLLAAEYSQKHCVPRAANCGGRRDNLHHVTESLLVSQRTALICALRGHMAEFGIIAPVGPRNVAHC